MTLPRVAVIGTGGTISSVGRDSLDVWQYMDHGTKLEASPMLAGISSASMRAATRTVDP